LPIRAPKNVLISYGGSDPTNETAKAVKAVLSLQKIMPFDLRFGRIDIVIGPLNPRASAIIAAAKEVTGAVIHHDPPCLAPLMRDADICLTAGGNTLIEALVMHKCCIVTTTAENQEVIVDELLEEGSIVSLGRSTDVTMQDMATAIAEALRSYKKKAMRPVIGYDQFGASRIVQEMSRYSLHSTPMPL
jgi:spore coat polysaccharide biosynthesis predicted glycosyltransferase SpsG